MKKVSANNFYSTSIIPVIFIFSILFARYNGGHVLFHTIAEIFSIAISLMIIVIVSYTYQFTKNNFLLYLGLGYFWVAILDLLHMLTYPGMSLFPSDNSNTMLTFWLAARFLEAFILFSAIFVNFLTVSKLKVFILFGLVTAIIYFLAFSVYVPILYEDGSGLTPLKVILEYTIIVILMITIFIYTKKIHNFDRSIYYYIIASIVLTILTELTLTIYAQVDDSFTMLAHLFKFLSFWMIFLSIIKTSLEEPFKFLAHDSSTYNSIPFPSILVDVKGIIRQINNPTESFLHLGKDEIINQSNHILFHNQNIQEDLCEICQAIKNGEVLHSYTMEKDTSTYNITINPINMQDQSLGSVQVCFDITKEKNIEKELQISYSQLEEKKRELETILQEAPNPIMVHNEDGKVIMVNKIWEDLTGYTHKEIDTIEKWTYLAYGEKMSVVKEYIDSLHTLKQKVNEGEYPITTKDSKVIIWQFSSAPLGIIDGKRTVISSAMDITELKHKDEMLINQSRHAAMGEMIGMIAHQWRQPLASISMDANNMLLDILTGDLNSTESQKYANSISQQTQHLSKTIDDFRNFFKPDKVLSKVNLEDIINQTLSIVKDSFNNNNIKLISCFETEEEVTAYPRELMQVFVNIITNSKDALVSNKIEKPIIKIKVYEDDIYVNTDISDNGGGIDSDILPKIFDPYFSTKDEKTGTGIGLYMSKMIIENHLNGLIEVTSSNDTTCLTVKLLKEEMDNDIT